MEPCESMPDIDVIRHDRDIVPATSVADGVPRLVQW